MKAEGPEGMDPAGIHFDERSHKRREPGRNEPSALDDEVFASGRGSFGLIADRLESDPEECRAALEGFASLEPELRLAIVDLLLKQDDSRAARTLLRLMTAGGNLEACESANAGVSDRCGEMGTRPGGEQCLAAATDSGAIEAAHACDVAEDALSRSVATSPEPPRLVRCLVTPIDGHGRGSIVLSSTAMAERRTAAFLCDVQCGICDATGVTEAESADAGSLVDEIDGQSGAGGVTDAPELALGLLAGCLSLCGPEVPQAVQKWLDLTLGPTFQSAAFPVAIDGLAPSPVGAGEMPGWVDALLDRCPSWLDGSPLTFALAEEILLREEKPAADPARDAGLYRFLFEHRLIHRLELYRRMLLWMGWLWKCCGERELSATAFALVIELSDDQYAVPSHPFAVGIATRSLMAAERVLESARAGPR